jgi:uncharacterized protein (TIGR02328 family)
VRIWHKDLISVLPRQHLLGQWRECCLIAKNIVEKGTPNHILVNRIMNYPQEHFGRYCFLIYCEMHKRGYKVDTIRLLQWSNCLKFDYAFLGIASIDDSEIFKDWHNVRYLRQCLYNLQEKFDSGSISQEEWNKIKEKFADRFDIIW